MWRQTDGLQGGGVGVEIWWGVGGWSGCETWQRMVDGGQAGFMPVAVNGIYTQGIQHEEACVPDGQFPQVPFHML